MLRRLACGLLGFFFLVYGGFGCTSTIVSAIPTANGYTVSLDVVDRDLWLGPQSLGDPRPNMTAVVVEVRDRQGQRSDGVAVEFSTDASWSTSLYITPQRTVTQGGIARTLVEPRLIGTAPLLVQVDGQVLKTRIYTRVREFAHSKD